MARVGIFAAGAAKFFGAVGIPVQLGAEFAMLAISTFLLTTLDTCTRLTRFLIEELFSWRNEASRYLGTAMALALPCLLVFQQFPGTDGTLQPAWKAMRPLFGATNQLLAALALLTFVVFFESIQGGLWICPASRGGDDRDANDGTRSDGPKIWNFHLCLEETAAAMFLLGIFSWSLRGEDSTRSEGDQLQTEAS